MKICRAGRRCAVLIAVGFFGLAGCSSANTGAPNVSTVAPPAPTAPLAVPYHSADGYSISPPAGWVFREATGVPGLSAVFAAMTPDLAGQKPFADNLNVLITPTSQNLDTLIEQTKQQTPAVLANYKPVLDEPTVVNGQPGHLLGGTYDQEGTGSVQNMQLSLVSGGKEYTITFTTTAPTFEKYRAVAQASLSSFILG